MLKVEAFPIASHTPIQKGLTVEFLLLLFHVQRYLFQKKKWSSTKILLNEYRCKRFLPTLFVIHAAEGGLYVDSSVNFGEERGMQRIKRGRRKLYWQVYFLVCMYIINPHFFCICITNWLHTRKASM